MKTRKFFGSGLMLLGILLLLGSAALLVYNWEEAEQARESVELLLPQLVEQIDLRQQEQATQSTGSAATETVSPDASAPSSPAASVAMTEVEIDGYSYIGYLTIPALELELPIMADWDYTRLKIAPCRYSGAVSSGDLVLLAHNYNRHFGRLDELAEGDLLLFTDMDGVVTRYQVVATDILPPTAVEEMTAGAFDLTLFTCTYGGRNRVTVYCDRMQK